MEGFTHKGITGSSDDAASAGVSGKGGGGTSWRADGGDNTFSAAGFCRNACVVITFTNGKKADSIAPTQAYTRSCIHIHGNTQKVRAEATTGEHNAAGPGKA